MKASIKLTSTRAITIEPAIKTGLIGIHFTTRSAGGYSSTEGEYITPEQAAALIFSLESALEGRGA